MEITSNTNTDVHRNTATTSHGQLDPAFSSHKVFFFSILGFSFFQLYIKVA